MYAQCAKIWKKVQYRFECARSCMIENTKMNQFWFFSPFHTARLLLKSLWSFFHKMFILAFDDEIVRFAKFHFFSDFSALWYDGLLIVWFRDGPLNISKKCLYYYNILNRILTFLKWMFKIKKKVLPCQYTICKKRYPAVAISVYLAFNKVKCMNSQNGRF